MAYRKAEFGGSVLFLIGNKLMKTILYILIGVIFLGCLGDCQESTYAYRSRQCSIIVDEQNSSGRYITLKGRNSQTGQEDRFHDQGGWYPDIYKLIEVGDTVIKRENEMMFYIHKRDTVLAIPYDCQGKIYK